MTPDLQARIEKLARECLDNQTICECQSCLSSAIEAVTKALTTLAEQIIAEKDAEAAGMREAIRLRLQSVSLVLREGRQRQPGNQYVSDAVWHGWIHERKVLDELLEIELPTAGRDTLAELASLRVRVRELEGAYQSAVNERVALESKWMKVVEAIQFGPLTITPEGE